MVAAVRQDLTVVTEVSAQKRLQQLKKELNQVLVERTEMVDLLLTTLLAKSNIFLGGDPGEGKTYALNTLASAIDARYGYHLFGAETTVDEFVGAIDVVKLTNESKFERDLDGGITKVEIFAADEAFKCLTGETLITTSNGQRRRIDSFNNEHLPVLTSIDIGSLTLHRSYATKLIVKDAERVYKITLNSGKTIRATADHQFLVRYQPERRGDWVNWTKPEWQELQEVKVGGFLATPTMNSNFGNLVVPEWQVIAAGLLIADGGCTTNQIRYTKTDEHLIGAMKKAAEDAGDELVPVDSKSYRLRRTNIRTWVRSVNLNKLSIEKTIPDAFFQLNRRQLAQFIGVLWSGDGYINRQRGLITYATSSRLLADELQHLLLRFGVVSRVLQFQTTDGFCDKERTAYRLTVNKFSNENFYNSFAEFMLGKQFDNLNNINLKSRVSERRSKIEKDVFWDQIKSIEIDGEEKVYCFSSSSGNFIANDIIVHNCNSPGLNAQLSIINEKVYKSGKELVKCPLQLYAAMSNELPEDESLGAFWDRLAVRYWVPATSRRGRKTLMMREAGLVAQPTIATKLTLTELDQMRSEIQAIELGESLIDEILDISEKLFAQGFKASTRKFVQLVNLVKSYAYVRGHKVVESSDLSLLEHILWNEPEQRKTIAKTVKEVADAGQQAILNIMADIQSSLNRLEQPFEDDARKKLFLNATDRKLKTAQNDLKNLESRYPVAAKALSEVMKMRNMVLEQLADMDAL